jgi:hypothetical protein
MNAADPSNSRATLVRRLLGALLLIAPLACLSTAGREDVPPQGWWAGRGPVVPHETFPADCTLCHTGDDWQTLRDDFEFDHLAETGYALVGAHARAECLRCHNDRGPAQAFANRGCAGCHEDVHRNQLGSNCESCHDQGDWRPNEAIAAHNRTRFPLIGSHAAVPCFRCHLGAQVGNFIGADTECTSCHQADLAQALDPDHLAQGWTQNCEECHIATAWSGGGFNHAAWPLTGQHAAIDCALCHVGGQFGGIPTDCYDCHMADFTATTDPNHVALNFSQACDECHGTATWSGAQFNHAGIVNGCFTCHADDYGAANDPNHVQLGISTNCEQCHGVQTWDGAQFDHVGITTGCIDCHAQDYTQTTNPNHALAGFPTSCEQCHGTNNWNQASFNHTFPINGGNHGNLSCNECHQVPSSFRTFSCTHCHEHSQGEMADEHDEVNGYVWSSPACYNCHPDGND